MKKYIGPISLVFLLITFFGQQASVDTLGLWGEGFVEIMKHMGVLNTLPILIITFIVIIVGFVFWKIQSKISKILLILSTLGLSAYFVYILSLIL